MSSLNSLFNRGLLGAKCKTSLNLAISRIKLLRNRREVQLSQMRKEISQFLQTGQEAIARIRVEHVIREQNILSAYEIVELFCEFILARVPILDTQRTCPPELQEAIASTIFAAPRCSDVPELMNIRNLFATKYGKEFISAAAELRPDSGVNRVIIEKLSVKAPSGDVKVGVLKGIAQEYNIQWDSSNTEAEFCKKHEDLLEGLHPANIVVDVQKISTSSPTPRSAGIAPDTKQNHCAQAPDSPSLAPVNKNTSFKNSTTGIHEIKPVVNSRTEVSNYNEKSSANLSSSDAMERARAAIASADRACAAAREAAKLVNIRFSHQIGNDYSGA